MSYDNFSIERSMASMKETDLPLGWMQDPEWLGGEFAPVAEGKPSVRGGMIAPALDEAGEMFQRQFKATK